TEEPLPSLEMAKEMSISKQEKIYFIGNPLRFQGIANEGTMIGYTKLTNGKKETIMLKATVYGGNSGSPVLNYAGQVIGVVVTTLEHTEHGKVGLFVAIDYLFEKVNVECLID